ncbi:MAG: hypothetical protein M3418_07260 [Gemmatimonadota bacterium]|nr:hypothetical protein [Gemmatimonadota bacterium]
MANTANLPAPLPSVKQPPPFRAAGDTDLNWLSDSPPRPINAAAVIAEARNTISSWDDSTSISTAQLDAYIIVDFLSRLVKRESSQRAAA